MSFIHTQGITIIEAFKEMFQAIEDKKPVEIVGIAPKECSICKLHKNIKYFNKNRVARDGFQDKCKVCQSNHNKQKQNENEN
jgi:hypothetical protein